MELPARRSGGTWDPILQSSAHCTQTAGDSGPLIPCVHSELHDSFAAPSPAVSLAMIAR